MSKVIDYGNAPELFVNGLPRVQNLGTVTRLTFTTSDTIEEGGPLHDVAAVKLIVPSSLIGEIIRRLVPAHSEPDKLSVLTLPAIGGVQ